MSHSIRRTRDSEGGLLDRILDTPHLAQAVPRLPAELLHRVIDHQGLEDCAELVALATPEQLARVFDLDLWQPARPGLDEQFDAGRFGVWLQVLLEGGAGLAAAKLAAMAPDVVIAGLAQHARVFDAAAMAPYQTIDGELAGARDGDNTLTCEIGAYHVAALRDDAWGAIVEVLQALQAAHNEAFHRVMAGCRALSNSRPEPSGMHDLLDDREQGMFDLGFAREGRREQQGYVTPAQARAFLDMARRPVSPGAAPPDNPIVKAYFRSLNEHAAGAASQRGALPEAAGAGDAAGAEESMAALVEVLLDSGVLSPAPRALLAASAADVPRLSRMQDALRLVLDRDPDLYAVRSGELGYLANTLVSGGSLQARPFTPQEASDAAVAICNLGLELWPGVAAADVLLTHDIVSVFQIGWAALYERVSVPVARRLIEVLTLVRSPDRETQVGLNQLRVQLKKALDAGAPWRVGARLEVISSLDLPAWAVLVGLLDECPVMAAAIGASRGEKPHRVSATAFEFISEIAQIDTIHEFLASLPETLRS